MTPRFCANCGNPRDGQGGFCAKCGSPFGPRAVPDTAPRRAPGIAGTRERFVELGQLRYEGLITGDEYAAKRAAFVDAL